MTLDEALAEAVAGHRITATHMQPGCYVEHSFSRGYLRCWAVPRAAEEPGRTQCDFRASDADIAAEWRLIEDGEQYPKKVSSAWGNFVPSKPVNDTPLAKALHIMLQPGFGKDKPPPIADVIDLSAPASDPLAGCGLAVSQPWAPSPKLLDPNKGGW